MTITTIGAAFLLSLVCAFSLQAADGNASKDAFVLPGDVLIPQIATGGDGTQGFYMTFQTVNITNAPASVQISFFDSAGNPMVLDFEQDGTPGTASFLSTGISVLAIPRWSGYSDPRLGCKVFVFLSRSMLRSLPFGSLNAARSPRSSSLEGFSPTRLRVVPSSATQRLFSVAAVARYPPGTGSAQIRPSISANSLRLRCPSANSSQ